MSQLRCQSVNRTRKARGLVLGATVACLSVASLAAAQANSTSWRSEAESLTDMMVEMVYEIEPGYGYATPAP